VLGIFFWSMTVVVVFVMILSIGREGDGFLFIGQGEAVD
jgi:hypothetical protein